MFEQFTDHARAAMVIANREALQGQASHVSLEHVLLGMLSLEDSNASLSVRTLGVDPETLEASVRQLLSATQGEEAKIKPPLATNGKRGIELAIEEARALNHNFIGTGHMLLGLIRAAPLELAAVIEEAGLTDLDKMRELVSYEQPTALSSQHLVPGPPDK